MFYTYIHLDTSTPGNFVYGNFLSLLYKPVYVGKGKDDRVFCSSIELQKKNPDLKLSSMIILSGIKESCAFCYESFLISLIGRKDLYTGPLLNKTDGGDGLSGHIFSEEHRTNIGKKSRGRAHTEATKQKMREKKLGIKFSLEHKRKLSESRMGSNNPMFGKKRIHSEETKEKMSKTKAGCNNPMFGKKRDISEETRRNISIGLIGKYPKPMLGKKHSEKSKQKMRDARMNFLKVKNSDI